MDHGAQQYSRGQAAGVATATYNSGSVEQPRDPRIIEQSIKMAEHLHQQAMVIAQRLRETRHRLLGEVDPPPPASSEAKLAAVRPELHELRDVLEAVSRSLNDIERYITSFERL